MKKIVLVVILIVAIFAGCVQQPEDSKIRTVTIDFTGCKYMIELHQEMARQLEFPSFYGNNLAALWDCLTGIIETPVEVHFKGIDRLPKDLQQEALKMYQVFVEAEEKYGEVHPICD